MCVAADVTSIVQRDLVQVYTSCFADCPLWVMRMVPSKHLHTALAANLNGPKSVATYRIFYLQHIPKTLSPKATNCLLQNWVLLVVINHTERPGQQFGSHHRLPWGSLV